MADDKKTDASNYLGGMSGDAAKSIKTRASKIDDAVDKATGSSPNTQPDTGADGNGRAAPRKRWFE